MREIRFVDVGEGITEGHMQKWLVKDGSSVKEDQPIAQVETDKAVVNVPAPISGTVRFSANEGSDLKVGDLIATVYAAGEQPVSNGPSTGPAAPKQESAPLPPSKLSAPATPIPFEGARPGASLNDLMLQSTPPEIDLERTQNGRGAPDVQPQRREVIATPYVRKLARDNGIDLSAAVGTGPGGRVLENDIRGMLHRSQSQQKPVPKFSEVLEEQHAGQIERVPLTQTRKAIARNMELSWTIPRAVHMDMINATKLYSITTSEKENAAKMGIKLTFLPFIIKAVVAAPLSRTSPNA